jgi:SAM-dependent methyltransferase
MTESSEFWDFYWEMRLQSLQNLGKKAAILAASRLIRKMLVQAPGKPVRLLELGCGEGQIIGALVDGHAQAPAISSSVGVDYIAASVEKCRRAYPGMTFIEGDFTDNDLLDRLGQFEIVILVNALHEVFSSTFSESLQEVDVPLAKQRVAQAFTGAAARLAPGGYLLLFDGLEPPGDLNQKVRLRFLSPQSADHFETFAREYHPFQIRARASGGPNRVELSLRDFTRYITKSIFLGKALWQSERFESYQYYNESEFRAAFDREGLVIHELRTLTVDEDKWRRTVAIESPGVKFPEEHILIIAQKPT